MLFLVAIFYCLCQLLVANENIVEFQNLSHGTATVTDLNEMVIPITEMLDEQIVGDDFFVELPSFGIVLAPIYKSVKETVE